MRLAITFTMGMADGSRPIDCPDDASSTFLMFDFLALGQDVPLSLSSKILLRGVDLMVDRYRAESCNQIKFKYLPL